MEQPTNTAKPATKPNKMTAATAIVFFVALGLTFYSLFAETFPSVQIINFQAKMFDGSYYVKLTFLLTLITIWLPMLGIQKLIELMMKKK